MTKTYYYFATTPYHGPNEGNSSKSSRIIELAVVIFHFVGIMTILYFSNTIYSINKNDNFLYRELLNKTKLEPNNKFQ